MEKTYVYVTGGKGGIGKTTLALALVDYLAENRNVLLIDADPINADSSEVYKKGKDVNVRAIRARVRSEDTGGQIDPSGLMETINIAVSDPADIIIIDAPAGDSILLATSGSIITSACKQAGIVSVFIWLVDSNDRTAVNALNAAWDSIQYADKVFLVKNYRKGSNFDFFDQNAAVINIVSSPNVVAIDLPKFASRIEEHLRIERLTWKEIATVTPIGNRVEGQRLRTIFHQTFNEAGL